MPEATPDDPNQRFATIFKALMIFCALVWIWGLILMKYWPWQTGGEWLPAFPIVVTCADNTACALPYSEISAARKSGRIVALTPPLAAGETAYEMIALQWKPQGKLIETKASAWNFQTTVRYRIDNEMPILVEYQEISGKVFLIAIGGALLTLIGLYLSQRRK